MSAVAHALDHNSLLCVEAVFSLVKDFVSMLFEYLCGNFLFTVSRQTVKYHCTFSGKSHSLVVDLVVLEYLLSLFSR